MRWAQFTLLVSLLCCGGRTGLDVPTVTDGAVADAISDVEGGIEPILAVSHVHACYRARGGDLFCWGASPNGELTADGGLAAVAHPETVLTHGVPVAVVAHDGNCILLANGNVDCWDVVPPYAATTTPPWISAPPGVTIETNAVAIFAASPGGDFACARTAGGLMCWGYRPDCAPVYTEPGFQFGPIARPDISSLESLSLDQDQLCGIEHGAVLCCGSGLLGDGNNNNNTPRNTLAPAALPPGKSAVLVANAFGHTCAVLDDTTVWCWGWNNHGQVGDGTAADRLVPVEVSGLNNVVELGLGAYHSCARLADGTARCWGDNDDGALGDGTTTSHLTPVAVVSPSGTGLLTDVVDLQAGFEDSCALVASGEVYCWGLNQHGQLGDGTTTERSVPTKVIGLP